MCGSMWKYRVWLIKFLLGTSQGNFIPVLTKSYYKQCSCVSVLKQEVGVGHKPLETQRWVMIY